MGQYIISFYVRILQPLPGSVTLQEDSQDSACGCAYGWFIMAMDKAGPAKGKDTWG